MFKRLSENFGTGARPSPGAARFAFPAGGDPVAIADCCGRRRSRSILQTGSKATLGFLFSFAAMALAGGHAAETDRVVRRSAEEKSALLAKASKPWTQARRWLIEYDLVETPGMPGKSVHNIMAVGSPGDYYKLKAHDTTACPWRDDPFTEESFIHNGVRCVRWPFSRMYREFPIAAGDEVEGTIGFDILWRILPACPLVAYRLPNLTLTRTSPVLGRALDSEECHLLADTETVNGESCAVFLFDDGAALKKSWIATRSGLCLMKEEIRYSKTDVLVQRLVTDRIGEVSPGIWLPLEYRIQWFHGDDQNVPQREVKARILSFRMNDEVPLSTFQVQHAPGSIKDEGKFVQVSPGGEELLLDMVRFMTQYAGLPTQTDFPATIWLWPVAGLTCGFGLGLIRTPFRKQTTK